MRRRHNKKRTPALQRTTSAGHPPVLADVALDRCPAPRRAGVGSAVRIAWTGCNHESGRRTFPLATSRVLQRTRSDLSPLSCFSSRNLMKAPG